jgi:hypothetical protein
MLFAPAEAADPAAGTISSTASSLTRAGGPHRGLSSHAPTTPKKLRCRKGSQLRFPCPPALS